MLFIGSDHAGYLMKEAVKEYLKQNNIVVTDVGCYSQESCNFVTYALELGQKVAINANNKGILICGSGVGVSIAANKVPGILAGVVYKKELAALAVEHDHINILCLSGRYVDINENLEIVKIFLQTNPLHDYHETRIRELWNYEERKKEKIDAR